MLSQFFDSEAGEDLVEYALIIALVIIGSAAAVAALGDSITQVWTAMDTRLESEK
jgi:Flp pilus assembly pilin Flp